MMAARKIYLLKNKLLKTGEKRKIILNQNVCTGWLCRCATNYQTDRLPELTAELRAWRCDIPAATGPGLLTGVHQPVAKDVGMFFTSEKLLFLHPVYPSEIYFPSLLNATQHTTLLRSPLAQS